MIANADANRREEGEAQGRSPTTATCGLRRIANFETGLPMIEDPPKVQRKRGNVGSQAKGWGRTGVKSESDERDTHLLNRGDVQ